MKLKGSVDELREQVFREKSKKRRLPYALKMKELEDVSDFIDEKKWKVKNDQRNNPLQRQSGNT